MSIRRGSLALLALLLSLGAHAQGTAPAKADAKTDAKADPKAEEAAAAMERAKRLAAGPMRVILEASKGKRPPAEAPVVDGASVRTVAARPAAAQAAPDTVGRAAPQPAATEPSVAATAPAPVPAAPAPVNAAAPESAAVVTQITLGAGALQTPGAAPVPAIERSVAATPAAVPSLPAPLPALAVAADAQAKPKLVSRVDPELPQRLLDDLGRNAVLAVDLSIRADGSVGGVSLVTTVPPRVQRVVVAALEQWRFEPLPGGRVHRIELVFNGE